MPVTFMGRIDDTMLKKNYLMKEYLTLEKSDEWWLICIPLHVFDHNEWLNSKSKDFMIDSNDNHQLTLLLLFMIDAENIKILLRMEEAIVLN